MPHDITLVSALVVGLLGSTHCVGMCGGIVGTLSLAAAGSRAQHWSFLVAYNLGRIASYAAVGALLGALGEQLFEFLPAPAARTGARLLSAGFMIALGLYLTGWWTGLGALERVGARLWRHVAPFARRLLPVRRLRQAWLVGMVWGFLPCGLVYSVLAWSLGAGSAAGGAALMAAFGAGTVPLLLVSGGFARTLGAAVRGARMRRICGLAVLAFGLYSLLPAGAHQGHHHGAEAAARAAAPDGA